MVEKMKPGQQKSLQNFTDSAKSPEHNQIGEKVQNRHESAEKRAIVEQIMQKLGELDLRELKKLKERADERELAEIERCHNYTWQENHQKIKKAMLAYVVEKEHMPTITELGKITLLSRVTITEHIRHISFDDLYKEDIKKYEFLIDSLLGSLFSKALHEKDSLAAKTFFEIMTFLNSKQNMGTAIKEVKVSSTVNLIQQNFTLMKNFFVAGSSEEKELVRKFLSKVTEE